MDTTFDYVQIIVESDWGLVGIVPPNTAGEKIKQMAIIPIPEKAEELVKDDSDIFEAPIINDTPTESLVTPVDKLDPGFGSISKLAVTTRRPNNLLQGFGR